MNIKKFNSNKFKGLIEALNSAGISKEQLAVELKCSFSAIYKWMTGAAVPSPDVLYNIIELSKGKVNVTFEGFFTE